VSCNELVIHNVVVALTLTLPCTLACRAVSVSSQLTEEMSCSYCMWRANEELFIRSAVIV